MTLAELVQGISGFGSWNHVERIKLFAWHLHTHKGREYFGASDVKQCYEDLHLQEPTSIAPFLGSMEKKKPKELIKKPEGYKLEMRIREGLDRRFGSRTITIQVTDLLAKLPSSVPDLAERTFLDESLGLL
jgi:hypothetical protein